MSAVQVVILRDQVIERIAYRRVPLAQAIECAAAYNRIMKRAGRDLSAVLRPYPVSPAIRSAKAKLRSA